MAAAEVCVLAVAAAWVFTGWAAGLAETELAAREATGVAVAMASELASELSDNDATGAVACAGDDDAATVWVNAVVCSVWIGAVATEDPALLALDFS